MKRLCTILTAVAVLLTCAVAEPIAEDALLVLAEVMAESVDVAAGSDAWHGLFETPAAMRDIIDSWAAGDHRKAESVYRIVIGEKHLAEITTDDPLTPVLNASLIQRAMVAVISTLNAAHGSEVLAASSITSVSTGFAGTVECSIYILGYAEGADVAVCFYPFDGGTSGAYATFLAGEYNGEKLAEMLDSDITIERIR